MCLRQDLPGQIAICWYSLMHISEFSLVNTAHRMELPNWSFFFWSGGSIETYAPEIVCFECFRSIIGESIDSPNLRFHSFCFHIIWCFSTIIHYAQRLKFCLHAFQRMWNWHVFMPSNRYVDEVPVTSQSKTLKTVQKNLQIDWSVDLEKEHKSPELWPSQRCFASRSSQFLQKSLNLSCWK